MMAHFASGRDYEQCISRDIEEDCGPAEDEVDGCAMPFRDICRPAGFSSSKALPQMMSRGFGNDFEPKLLNKSGTSTKGNIFENVHPMVILPNNNREEKPSHPKSSAVLGHQSTSRQEQPSKACPWDQAREMDNKDRYDSCYDSGLTENAVYMSGDVPPQTTRIFNTNNKTCDSVTNQLDKLKINDSAVVNSFSEKERCVSEKNHNFSMKCEDEAYYSEERCPSEVCPVPCQDKIELMFCEQDKEGDTQAHLLLIHNRVSSFLILVSQVTNPAFLNVQNFLLQNLLHLSVILNQPEVVRKLIARGADVDARDRHGNTPLHIACERGYYDCVIALTTPLDHREVRDIQFSVPYQRVPQDQDIKNYNGMTCLHLAAENEHINIVNHLITMCCADINAQEGKGGETILHRAVERCSEDVVKYLLLHRELHLEASRYDGCTALQMAKGYANHRMINLLINAGADNSQSSPCSDSDDDLMVDGSDDPDLPYDDFRIGGSLVAM